MSGTTNICFYVLVVAVVIAICHVNVASSDGSAPPDIKDKRIRPMSRWVGNFTRQLDSLLPDYFQQILLQSQIASSLSQYADAITADNDYNQTCIAEHKAKYTRIKLQVIADYRTCSSSSGSTLTSGFAADRQDVLQKLAELDKKFVYISQRCDFSSSYWFLNTFLRTLRDLCHLVTESAMNRELTGLRNGDMMNLYSKVLLMVVNNGKLLSACIAKASAASITAIDANIDAISKCINS